LTDEDRIERLVEAIASDRKRGAAELAVRALRVFRHAKPARGISAAAYRRAVLRLGQRLARTRINMAPISGVMSVLIHDFLEATKESERSGIAYQALTGIVARIARDVEDAKEKAAGYYVSTFSRVQRPLVISYSSQVIRALTAAPRNTLRVTVCESRPAFEGRRTARLLLRVARSVTLITESQIMLAMERCDGAVLGCDAIYEDGSVLNKSGSHLIALAAKNNERPVIVMGDGYKLAERREHSLESHPDEEVWRRAARGVRIENVVFEDVPGRLMDFYVLESGVHRIRELKALWRSWRKYRPALGNR
jgi:translation initiation factor eIF-2B subunit delta